VFSPADELNIARKQAGLSMRKLGRVADRPVSTIARIEAGVVSPSTDVLDGLLRACGKRMTVVRIDAAVGQTPEPTEEMLMPSAPTSYPNPRNDDAWDNDAVHYLLDQPVVSSAFKRGPLMECLRRQPNRLRNQPDRVEQAAALASRFGVELVQIYDPKVGKTLVRLIRTDDSAPAYPQDRIGKAAG